ncbi:MAG: Rrf2 family transcriptional regulator [Candidatus Aminicenantes bacterium]|nr:Rrf2 family transcriptional regulator [Candidatus Aminicenantes bacterium]
MKLINRDTDYAVKALLYLTQKDPERVSVSELIDDLDIPRPFLRKILQTLNRKGVLNSYKGKGGGFVLAMPPEKILLIRLIDIFQKPVKLTECIFKEKICSDIGTCPLKKRIDAIEQRVISELESVTMASLLKEDLTSQVEYRQSPDQIP